MKLQRQIHTASKRPKRLPVGGGIGAQSLAPLPATCHFSESSGSSGETQRWIKPRRTVRLTGTAQARYAAEEV